MEITEIRIKLMEGSEDRLRAFCSITLDQSFVVRDLKIIDGTHGPFVAMPSRKLTGHCGRCGQKNHLRATFCNGCGGKLSGLSNGSEPPQKLYADVAHPINSQCRERIQDAVIAEFQAELARSQQPGYRSRYDDDFDAGDYDESDYSADERKDTFGAGLLPEDASAKDPSPMDSSMATQHPKSPVTRSVANDVVARGDQAPPHPVVPKPHFHDRQSGGQSISVPGSPQRGQGIVGEDDEPVTDDNDGFGAGIFDS